VPDPKDASVMRLVALAEGLSPFWQKQAFIYREDVDMGMKRDPDRAGADHETAMPDVPLQINDVLYIPDNPGQRRAVNIADRAPAFAAGTVSGILIWRR
jgi:hypothetical protein